MLDVLDLVLLHAHASFWEASDVASLLCATPRAVNHLKRLDLKVVLKSGDHAKSFCSWLDKRASLLHSLELDTHRSWWAKWCSMEHYGGAIHYSDSHRAAGKALVKVLEAAGSRGDVKQLTSFTAVHSIPTDELLQVLPTSLTQLRLSYATNELGEAPEPMQILLAEIDPEADEGEGIMLTEECHWYDWVTPLVNGLARLTGLRNLTLNVDVSCTSENFAAVKYADNSAILRAVKPLTLLTELRLPNSKYEDLDPATQTLLQLPASLQRLAVYESRTHRSRGQSTCASLNHLSALTLLDLGDCYIEMPRNPKPGDPPVLPPCLRHISCSSADGGGCQVAVLKTLQRLEHLEPGYDAATLAEMGASLKSLTYVELRHTLGEDEQSRSEPTLGISQAVALLQAAGVAGAVRKVHLDAWRRDTAGPQVLQQLADLPNLCTLRLLSPVRFTDDGLSALSCLTVLTELNCWEFGASSQQLLQQLPDAVEQLPLLRKLVVPNSCELDKKLSKAEKQVLKDRLMRVPHLSCVGFRD